jgi:hydrogenase nickel incorporation protein HypA/HybF
VHELSLAGAIADVVSRRSPDRVPDAVRVRVGALRQVVPESLLFCWTMVVADTDLADTTLELDHIPVRVHCRRCATDSTLRPPLTFACVACGNPSVQVTAGEEFEVTALQFAAA